MQENVNMAMPFGLPNDVSTLAAHYQNLSSESTIEKQADQSVNIWTTDNDAFSGLHTMSKCLLLLIPSGEQAPDGRILANPALVMKPWLWDYIEMSKNSGTSVLPSRIFYDNVDSAKVREALRAEFAGNPRYSSLNAAEKTDLENRFVAGGVRLLTGAEVLIGRGVIEAAGPHAGERKFELVFYDADDNKVGPEDVIEVFRLIGGRKMSGHPLLDAFSRAVYPAMAPLEGGIRIKVAGLPFIEGTTVQIGANEAIEIRISSSGNTLYATVPLRDAAGAVDVVVTIPGNTPRTFTNAIQYTTDIVDTTRAIAFSYLIYLTEIKEIIDSRLAAGTLTDPIKEEIDIEWGLVKRRFNDIVYNRSAGGGGSIGHPQVAQAWENSGSLLSSLIEDIYASIVH